MLLSVFAEGELSYVWQYVADFFGLISCIVHACGIFCYLFETDAADGRYLCAEVVAQEVFAYADGFEYFCSAI